MLYYFKQRSKNLVFFRFKKYNKIYFQHTLGDTRVSITPDKKEIKNHIEQFDDPETVEKFLRDLLNPDLCNKFKLSQ